MQSYDIGEQTLSMELNNYLSRSRLSMSQIASKLGVSKGHLSEIKNGKAQPALNTGLRILKTCGFSIDQRKAWAHFYNKTVSEEYFEVHDQWEKERPKELNEKVSTLLSSDIDLMNCYVDIVNSEEQGIEVTKLQDEYGKSIINKVKRLEIEGVLQIEEGNVLIGPCDPIMTRNSSYELMKRVFDDQQLKYQTGDLNGKFKFEINDLSDEGYEALRELFDETMKQAAGIISDNKLNRDKGGKRYVFQTMVGQLKSVLMILFLGGFMALTSIGESYAQSGGLSGGSTDEARGRWYQIVEYFTGPSLENRDWKAIQNNSNLYVDWPMFKSGENFSPIYNLCQEKDLLKTIHPVKVCLEEREVKMDCLEQEGEADCYELLEGEEPRGQVEIRKTCEDHDYKHLEIPTDEITFGRGENLKRLSKMRFKTGQRVKAKIEVFELKWSNSDPSLYYYGSKTYHIPECE